MSFDKTGYLLHVKTNYKKQKTTKNVSPCRKALPNFDRETRAFY